GLGRLSPTIGRCRSIHYRSAPAPCASGESHVRIFTIEPCSPPPPRPAPVEGAGAEAALDEPPPPLRVPCGGGLGWGVGAKSKLGRGQKDWRNPTCDGPAPIIGALTSMSTGTSAVQAI